MPVREATPNEVKVAVTGYGAADKEQVGADGRGRAWGSPSAPRPTTRPTRWRSRSGPRTPSGPGGRGSRSSVLDRAAVDPIARGEPASANALRARRARGARARRRPPGRARQPLGAEPMIASLEGVVGGDRRRLAGRRGRRRRVPGVRRAVGARAARARRPAQALHLPPRARGPAGAVRLPDVRGAGVLQAAAHGDGRRARRSRWRSSARARPPTSSSRSCSRTRRCSSSIPGIGKKLAERIIFELKEKVAAAGVAAIGVRGRPARRVRGRGRRRAPGAGLLAGRGARGVARWRSPTRPSGAGLEERVKAALRTLLRD